MLQQVQTLEMPVYPHARMMLLANGVMIMVIALLGQKFFAIMTSNQKFVILKNPLSGIRLMLLYGA